MELLSSVGAGRYEPAGAVVVFRCGVGIDLKVTLEVEAAEIGDKPAITRKNLKCH